MVNVSWTAAAIVIQVDMTGIATKHSVLVVCVEVTGELLVGNWGEGKMDYTCTVYGLG